MIKKFILRGLLFCWGGPLVLAIVWICLDKFNVASDITLKQASLSIISLIILAFIVAGITVIYESESIPKITAGLIQCFVLYLSYLIVYLINGWINKESVLKFTLIFITIFIIVWIAVYALVNSKVNRINKQINKS